MKSLYLLLLFLLPLCSYAQRLISAYQPQQDAVQVGPDTWLSYFNKGCRQTEERWML